MANETPKPVFTAPVPPATGKATAPQMPAYRPAATPVSGAPTMPASARPAMAQQPTGTIKPAAMPIQPEKGLYDDNFAAQFNLPPVLLTTKVMGAILAGIFFFGIMFGATVFGGKTQTTTTGLQGVVRNPEVAPGRKRCGIAERTQGCVLFIMNASRRDREARSFYDEAARITGVPSYTIELGNIEYATSIIRPGYLAQINVPAANR